ncbi:MAG: cell division protein SepF [Candidatus Methanomethylophilaceae archaeon]
MKLRFKKKEKAEEELPKVFIDLGEYDIEDEESVIKVRMIDVVRKNDILSVKNQMGKGRILLVDVSKFEGDDAEKEGTVSDLKAVVREIGGQLFTVNENTALITPINVVVDRVKIKRKAEE